MEPTPRHGLARFNNNKKADGDIGHPLPTDQLSPSLIYHTYVAVRVYTPGLSKACFRGPGEQDASVDREVSGSNLFPPSPRPCVP